ncbi:MAG: hypothetical protein HY332_17520 [Chloroflexi bacterium]|nr:hypothetical protein [Chloroflexota bacterium]
MAAKPMVQSVTPSRAIQRPSRWAYALCYALYAVLIFLCYESFWAWRSTVEVVVGYYFRRHEAFQFVYLLFTLLSGLALFIVVAVSESYLRRGLDLPAVTQRASRPAARVLRRFARIAIPLVLALLVAFALQEWTFRRAGL